MLLVEFDVSNKLENSWDRDMFITVLYHLSLRAVLHHHGEHVFHSCKIGRMPSSHLPPEASPTMHSLTSTLYYKFFPYFINMFINVHKNELRPRELCGVSSQN